MAVKLWVLGNELCYFHLYVHVSYDGAHLLCVSLDCSVQSVVVTMGSELSLWWYHLVTVFTPVSGCGGGGGFFFACSDQWERLNEPCLTCASDACMCNL